MNGWLRRSVLALGLAMTLAPAHAHDFRVGAMVIDHPYATPSLPGTSSGAVYIKVLRNTGRVSDRLIAASSKVADRVLLHSMQVQGEVMRMRAVSAIEVPAQSELRMGHGNDGTYHLMLEGLKAPLKDGDRFELTLRFENAGERTVKVWVQTPRGKAAHTH